MKNWENPPKDWAEAQAIEILKNHWNIPMRDMLAKAIRDERERCAELADRLSKEVGNAIRGGESLPTLR